MEVNNAMHSEINPMMPFSQVVMPQDIQQASIEQVDHIRGLEDKVEKDRSSTLIRINHKDIERGIHRQMLKVSMKFWFSPKNEMTQENMYFRGVVNGG